MSSQIASSSRISDLVHTLPRPIEYVRAVLTNFVLYDYDPETTTIRIGVTGTGISPNYKIEEPSVPITLTVLSCRFETIVTPARTFEGRSHREMKELDDRERHDENWSTEGMSFADLKALMSSLSENSSVH